MLRLNSPFYHIVFDHLKTARGQLALSMMFLAASSALTVLEPWTLKIVVDYLLLGRPLPHKIAFLADILHGNPITALLVLGAAQVVIVVAAGSFAYGQQFITFRIGYQLVHKLRSKLFSHLQQLPMSFHSRARTGELMSKVTSDTTTLRDTYTEYLLTMASNFVMLIFMMVVMLMIDWRLGLVVVASFPLLSAVLYQVSRRMKVAARRTRAKEGNLASRLREMLGAVSVVQAFGRESYERDRFDEESSSVTEESIRAIRIQRAGSRLVNMITAVGSAAVLVFGGMQAMSGHITPGDLLVFLTYVQRTYKPVRNTARLSARMAKATASAERINEILEAVPEVKDIPNAVEAKDLKGEIRFENVSFSYQPGKRVLEDLSFHIPAGKRVAVVGASGAGKSTISNLLVRLCDPIEGRILVDGVDLRHYQRESLRGSVGMVFQNSLLFGCSIRENIAYGKLDATDEEIEDAARQAHAHDFIMQLPDGYDEVLSEGGSTLSGGQRQRLCIARALIRRPSILLMDEPTTAVDVESEALIRGAMQRVHAGKTMLMVAHQIYSVQDAELILVLKDGRIVEQGTHEELMARGRHYCELFRISAAHATKPMGMPLCD